MIGINGMAHVILTVSRFDLARAFYGKLLRRYARLLRSLRLARPRSNDVRLIFHGTPLVRKSSACEMSQSTVTRGTLSQRDKPPATLSQLQCTTPAPAQCLDLTYVFNDLFATTSFFGLSTST